MDDEVEDGIVPVIWPKTGSIWNEIQKTWTEPACEWLPNPLQQREDGAVCKAPANGPTGAVASSGGASSTGSAHKPTNTAAASSNAGTTSVCPSGVTCNPSTFMTSTTSLSSTTTVSKRAADTTEIVTSVSTTATGAPTTQVATRPSPTEEVSIYFEMSISASGDTVPTIDSYWQLIDHMLDSSIPDPCTAGAVDSASAASSISYKAVPWPPSFDVHNSISGRNGCHYIAETDGPGQLACDGVNAFACVAHDQNNQVIFCEVNKNGLDLTFVPKVRCVFPA